MNVQAILELADLIEKGREDLDFEMGDYFYDSTNNPHSCRSAACVAGWQYLKDRDPKTLTEGELCFTERWHDKAMKDLGLDHLEAGELFLPEQWWSKAYTREAAVKTLRHLAQTGEVVWNVELGDDEAEDTIYEPEDVGEA